MQAREGNLDRRAAIQGLFDRLVFNGAVVRLSFAKYNELDGRWEFPFETIDAAMSGNIGPKKLAVSPCVRANDPPVTSAAGQISRPLRHPLMTVTM